MPLISQNTKDVFKNTMDKLRADIGRPVRIPSGNSTTIDCPNCGYDEVKRRSTGVYKPTSPYPLGVPGPTEFQRVCPVCNGKGKYELVQADQVVVCIVNPLKPGDAELTPIGREFKFNYELSASIADRAVFENAKRVIVDGAVCEVWGVIPAGIGDLTQLTVYVGRN